MGQFLGSGDGGLALSVAAGGYLAIEGTGADEVDWFSKDGRDWQSGPIAVPRPSCPGTLGICDLWAFRGGWLGFAAEPGDDVAGSLWRSFDGVGWQPVRLPADVAPITDRVVGVTLDGTALFVLDPLHSGDPTQETLGALDPDGSWRRVEVPAACPDPIVDEVLPPSTGGPDVWVLSDGHKTCTSPDLRDWRRGEFPLKESACLVQGMVRTRLGILASSIPNDPGCRGVYQFLSTDGSHWAAIKLPIEPLAIVDGPAGVIGISQTFKSGQPTFTVWRLDP